MLKSQMEILGKLSAETLKRFYNKEYNNSDKHFSYLCKFESTVIMAIFLRKNGFLKSMNNCTVACRNVPYHPVLDLFNDLERRHTFIEKSKN